MAKVVKKAAKKATKKVPARSVPVRSKSMLVRFAAVLLPAGMLALALSFAASLFWSSPLIARAADLTELCHNHLDDDASGYIDMLDSGCAGAENTLAVGLDQTLTTEENVATSTVLAGEDFDGENGDILYFSISTLPSNGTLTCPGNVPCVIDQVFGSTTGTVPNVIYTPNPGYVGDDEYDFTASDGTDTEGMGPEFAAAIANQDGTITIKVTPAPIVVVPSTHSSQTVVITANDLDAGPTATAVGNNSGKWFMYNDTDDTIDNTLGSFVAGPASAVQGTGSIEFTLGASPFDRKNIATFMFSGTLLSQITAMSYSAYSHSGVAGATESPFFNFNVDFTGSGAWQKRLVYVPSANGSVTQDTWNTYDTINGGSALWTWSGFAGNGNKWPDNNTNQYRTWSDINAVWPTARVLPVGGWLGVRVGEPGPTDYSADVDKFVITLDNGINATTTTFDFEPTPTCSASQHLEENVCVENPAPPSGGGDTNPPSGGGTPPNNNGGGTVLGLIGSVFVNPSTGGGQVLGTSTEATSSDDLPAGCSAYLGGYMRMGSKNDPEQVKKLQIFLNAHTDAGLPVTGVFGKMTFEAVKKFQLAHWEQVLKPWVAFGLPTDHTSTGYVYKTTKHAINLLSCADLAEPAPQLP